jgi:predicted alpha/beta superfamily hydrolase
VRRSQFAAAETHRLYDYVPPASLADPAPNAASDAGGGSLGYNQLLLTH